MNYIGTHDGKFHCDEVFACYMLKKLSKFADFKILRTRDPKILEKCTIVVDVGGIYSHNDKRYDHHQRSFAETMKKITGLDFHTKLSSAGLVYAHYGKEVVAKILEIENGIEPNVDEVMYNRLYKNFVEAIDAIDNGIQQFDGTPKYILSSTLTSRVDSCNPAWNDPDSDPEKGFSKAMGIVGEEFEERVRYFYKSWLPARQLVLEAIKIRKEAHPSGRILIFEQGGMPWKVHFFELEEELKLQNEGICLVIFKDMKGTWRVQAIPVSETSGFENRILLPWKGYRDNELEEQSGIPGAIFVHISGFIGGVKTKEGALKMAEKTLEQWINMEKRVE